jgi:23S rRNA pseudouridine2605 synthase
MVEHSRQPNVSPSSRQEPEAGGERIAKALARAGVASRRDVERLIEAGRVALNGEVLTSPAVRIGKDDILTVDGDVVGAAEPTRLWRYHKPTGLVTTHKDPQNRPTVFEHLPKGLPRVISIGRLDLNSEGLLLLTNDGELARALELPSSGWVRQYRARAYGHTTQARLDTLKKGVTVEGVHYGPIEARLDKVQTKIVDGQKAAANLWITVSLNEGKNREVRRVLESIGLKVNRLIRLAYGPFALGTLPVGAAEEVGPRVVREQLADFIAPQNLPKADRRTPGLLAGAPAPQRRQSQTAHPGLRRDERREEGETRAHGPTLQPSKTLPKRGPRPRTITSQIKAGETKAGEAREKKVYKAGWAKPKPKPRPAPAGAKPKGRRSPKAR